MNINIKLTEAEAKGIKAYIEALYGVGYKAFKKDVEQYVRGLLDATFQNPNEAVGDYIFQEEGNSQK